MHIKEVVGINGPFARFGALVFDMLFTNVLFLIFGGPGIMMLIRLIPATSDGLALILLLISYLVLVFLGPAATASYYTMGKRFRGEESYTAKDFFKSYTQNMKQAIPLTLAYGFAALIVGYCVWLEIYNIELFGKMIYVIFPVQIFCAVELVFMIIYAFALLSRFEMKTKDIIKYAFIMSNKHLPTTLLLVIMLGAVVAGALFWNLAVGILGFGIYFYLGAALLEKVFKRYMPEEEEEEEYLYEDSMTEREKEEAAFQKERLERQEKALDKDRQAILEKYTGKKRDE